MSPLTVLLLFSGIIFSIWLGWRSVRNLVQARLLSRWRHPSLDGLSGRTVALRGDVRVREPLRLSPLGDCLWHREVVKVHRSRSTTTESDNEEKADFSLVVDGREFLLPDLPTVVHGGKSLSGQDEWAFTCLLWGEKRSWRQMWLPVVEHLTVVGRVRQVGRHWVVGRDTVTGLLFTVLHPSRTALKGLVKGGLGLAGAAAGMAAVIYFATR